MDAASWETAKFFLGLACGGVLALTVAVAALAAKVVELDRRLKEFAELLARLD